MDNRFFISNPTRQVRVFEFFVPSRGRTHSLEIAPGHQKPVPFDLTREDEDSLVKQLKLYGAKHVSEVKDDGLTPMIFNQAGEVAWRHIEHGNAVHEQAAEEIGTENMLNAIEKSVAETGGLIKEVDVIPADDTTKGGAKVKTRVVQ